MGRGGGVVGCASIAIGPFCFLSPEKARRGDRAEGVIKRHKPPRWTRVGSASQTSSGKKPHGRLFSHLWNARELVLQRAVTDG